MSAKGVILFCFIGAAVGVVLMIAGVLWNYHENTKANWLGNPVVFVSQPKGATQKYQGTVHINGINRVSDIEIGLRDDGTVVWRKKQ